MRVCESLNLPRFTVLKFPAEELDWWYAYYTRDEKPVNLEVNTTPLSDAEKIAESKAQFKKLLR